MPHAATRPECEICGGSGWAQVTDGNVTRMRRCSCWEAARLTHATGVPDFFRDARLASYAERSGNRTALEQARAWATGTRTGDLFFTGGVGTGKTRLAASLLNEVFLAGDRTAYFCSVPFLMLRQLQGFDSPEKKAEANDILDRCERAATLVLDDVAGAEKASDYSRGVIFTLYNQRLATSKRTIWTSNLTLGELAEFYGDTRLPSRIAGACGDVIEIGGSDWRLEGTRY